MQRKHLLGVHTGLLEVAGSQELCCSAFELMGYATALDDAMRATPADKQTFDRPATRLGALSAEPKADLGKRFEHEAAPVRDYRMRRIGVLP